MARAEYESQEALSAIIPNHVVAPIAWGYYEGDDTKSFYLTRFHNLQPRLPPLPQFMAIVKKLHQSSVSPTGKFGFHCKTYWGPPVMMNEWTNSWEEFWAVNSAVTSLMPSKSVVKTRSSTYWPKSSYKRWWLACSVLCKRVDATSSLHFATATYGMAMFRLMPIPNKPFCLTRVPSVDTWKVRSSWVSKGITN